MDEGVGEAIYCADPEIRLSVATGPLQHIPVFAIRKAAEVAQHINPA